MTARGRALAAALWAALAASCAAPRVHPPLPLPALPLTRTPEQAFRARAPRPGPARPFAPPLVEAFVLANGLTVLVVAERSQPVIVARLVAGDGGDDDVGVPEGLASLAVRAALDSARVEDATTSLELDTEVSVDAATIETRGLRDDLPSAIATLAAVVTRPPVTAATVARARTEQLDAIHTAGSRRTAIELANAALYGYGHPFARAISGTTESMGALTEADVARFLYERYVPARCALIVAGDTTREAVAREAERAFGAWPARPPAARVPPAVRQRRDAPRAHLIMSGASTASLLIAQDAVAPSAEAYYPLLVATTLLGGTLASRLPARLRAREGWSYDAHASLATHRDGGTLVVEAAVPLEHVADGLRALREEMQRLVDEPLRASELATARAAVLNDLEADFETDEGVVDAVTRLFAQGLPVDTYTTAPARLAAVRASDVRLAARDYLDANDAETVVVAPPSVIVQIQNAGIFDVETYGSR